MKIFKKRHHINKIALCTLILIFLVIGSGYAEENLITINANEINGKVSREVFGTNFTSYKMLDREFYEYSDFGVGIWDPKWNEPVDQVINLARQIGISSIRFPGGSGSNNYDWKKAIGRKRVHYSYGIDEFITTVKLIGAEPVFTISYYTGDDQDAADLVEYLNKEADIALKKELILLGVSKKKNDVLELSKKQWQNLFKKYVSTDKNTLNWANYRAINGHIEPYNVKYFEIGNEVYNKAYTKYSGNPLKIKELAKEYGEKYLKYYSSMKSVDNVIQIGVNLYSAIWNKTVLGIVKENLDFGIVHIYPTPIWGKGLGNLEVEEIFYASWALPRIKNEYYFQEIQKLFNEITGKSISLAITEYNAGFLQEKPIPYRHTLGAALLNAELLRIFMKPEHNIQFANHWNFINEYWSIISNHFNVKNYRTLYNSYFKRPTFYVFELYNKHFGEQLLNVFVKSEGYDIGDYNSTRGFIQNLKRGKLIGSNLLDYQWKITDFPGTDVEQREDYLMISFSDARKFDYYHASMEVSVKSNTYYKLTGYIKLEDFISANGLSLSIQDSRGWSKTHSSADSIRLNKTDGWEFVEVIYKTLPDAQAVNVLIRKKGKTEPLKGRVFVKDVQLKEFIPTRNNKIPYLSVNASLNNDNNRIFLMVINKNLEDGITTSIQLKDFTPTDKADLWILNGPSVSATNEKKHDNVGVTHRTVEITSNPFEITFEPHSLTAIEINRKEN